MLFLNLMLNVVKWSAIVVGSNPSLTGERMNGKRTMKAKHKFSIALLSKIYEETSLDGSLVPV